MIPLPSRQFCQRLFHDGVITAERWPLESTEHYRFVEDMIRQADQQARLDAPGSAPDLDIAAAQWALSTLAWGVTLLVDRANSGTNFPLQLAKGEPAGDLACHHWSVDLAFRFMAEVAWRAQVAASEDPLVMELLAIATRWPLASAGTKVAWDQSRERVVMTDPCLQRILADRTAERGELFSTLGLKSE